MNRPFEQVANDGLIYCHGPDTRAPSLSWLISMTGPDTPGIRMVEDFVANTCAASPNTWSFVGTVKLSPTWTMAMPTQRSMVYRPPRALLRRG